MIKIFHFDTGLTIIANEVISQISGDPSCGVNVVWEYPMVFQNQIDQQGRVQIMFNPMFMFSKDPKMTPISTNGLLFESEADDKMAEKYNGIVTQAKSAASGLIIPGMPSINIKQNIHKPSTNN